MDSTPPLHSFFVRGDETEGFERKAEENGQKVGEQCSEHDWICFCRIILLVTAKRKMGRKILEVQRQDTITGAGEGGTEQLRTEGV